MKETGVSRALDSLGRVVIPVELRRQFDIRENEKIEFYIEEDKIIMKKVAKTCAFCKNTEGLTQFKDKYICSSCIEELKSLSTNKK